jgi:hypothetical protein
MWIASEADTHAVRDDEPDQKGYLVSDLKHMTGLGNTALSKYRKSAGVIAPARGQKNHRFTASEARRILSKIVEQATERNCKDRCMAALNGLPKITS